MTETNNFIYIINKLKTLGLKKFLYASFWWLLFNIVKYIAKIKYKLNLGCYNKEIEATKLREDLIPHLNSIREKLWATDLNKFRKVYSDNYTREFNYTIELAEKILDHRILLFGKEFKLGDDIDWHLDPISFKKWPKIFTFDIDYMSDSRICDIKYSLELNRCAHFVTLGQAYFLTGEEKYYDEFENQLKSWIEQNRYLNGINWAVIQDVEIRNISLSLCSLLFLDSKIFQQVSLPVILSIVKLQNKHAIKYLSSKYFKSNKGGNHNIGEAAGLVISSIIFNKIKDSKKWFNVGIRSLLSSISDIISEDGVYLEQSSNYSHLVSDFLILTIVFMKTLHEEIPNILNIKTESLLTYLMYLTQPNGLLPNFGDCDGARALRLSYSTDFWDCRGWHCVGSILFKRNDFKFFSNGINEEAYWIIGLDGIDNYNKILSRKPKYTSIAFEKGGQYIIKDSWDSYSNYMFIRCGEFGYGGIASSAHSHSDELAIILSIKGIPVFIDQGTYTYNGDNIIRKYEKSVESHNTIQIDNIDQAEIISRYFFKNIPECMKTVWSVNNKTVIFEGYCEYDRLFHQREIKSDFYSKKICIVDNIENRSNMRKSIYSRFLLSPDINVEVDNEKNLIIFKNSFLPSVYLNYSGFTECKLQETCCSPIYGNLRSTERIILTDYIESKKQVTIEIKW